MPGFLKNKKAAAEALDAASSEKKGENKEQGKAKPAKEKETARETIESIVFAFVLAFLFRTFEAEAFVIPTGSMAPTLFGRHKDIECNTCGFEFQFGASSEISRDGNVLLTDRDGTSMRIREAICPNCRHVNSSAFDAPPYKGDRILVNKFQYEVGDPERFDVVVFKYPLDSKTNYIKRLAGLPGETIRIHNGNLYRLVENDREEILRKDDPEKQRVIQIPVYDDNHPPTALIEAGWPERWAAMSPAEAGAENAIGMWTETAASWESDAENRTYQLSTETAKDGNTYWMRYRNFTPKVADWEQFENEEPLEPKPRLIGDFCGYNTVSQGFGDLVTDESFWVSDINLKGEVTVDEFGPDADFVLELTEGINWYRCHLNPNSGEARLTRINMGLDAEDEMELAKAQTSFQGQGTYDFYFCNVDDRLCLWVNDELVEFGEAANYTSTVLDGPFPLTNDYTPAGIAMTSMSGQVGDLVIERDIYYHASGMNWRDGERLLGDAAEWQKAYRNARNDIDSFEISIPEDEFFVLGDNSPMSHDGRFWQTTNTVPRNAFVGKAFFIYWPHGIPLGLESGMAFKVSYHKKYTRQGELVTDRSYPLHYAPFYPHVSRMKRIR